MMEYLIINEDTATNYNINNIEKIIITEREDSLEDNSAYIFKGMVDAHDEYMAISYLVVQNNELVITGNNKIAIHRLLKKVELNNKSILIKLLNSEINYTTKQQGYQYMLKMKVKVDTIYLKLKRDNRHLIKLGGLGNKERGDT